MNKEYAEYQARVYKGVEKISAPRELSIIGDGIRLLCAFALGAGILWRLGAYVLEVVAK